MDAKALLGRIRRTATTAVSRAAPVAEKVAGEARRRLAGRRDPEERPSPESEPAGDAVPDPAPAPPTTGGPSPASIAKNVAPPRPSAAPAPDPAPERPDDSPGGKLPPRR